MNEKIVAVAGLLLGVIGNVSHVHAQFVAPPEAEANGLMDGILGCEFSDQGLVLNFAQNKPTMFNGLGSPGDACLPILAEFPLSFTRAPIFAEGEPNAEGRSVGPPDCLVWVVNGGEVSMNIGTVVCDLDEQNVLRTVFVDTGSQSLYTPAENEECFTTLDNLEVKGMRLSPSFAAKLGEDEHAVATLVYTAQKNNYLEVVECKLGEDGKSLVTLSRETSTDGMVAVPAGELCHDTMAQIQGRGLMVNTPVPAKKPVSRTTDPGCLIWDIDGGTILE